MWNMAPSSDHDGQYVTIYVRRRYIDVYDVRLYVDITIGFSLSEGRGKGKTK